MSSVSFSCIYFETLVLGTCTFRIVMCYSVHLFVLFSFISLFYCLFSLYFIYLCFDICFFLSFVLLTLGLVWSSFYSSLRHQFRGFFLRSFFFLDIGIYCYKLVLISNWSDQLVWCWTPLLNFLVHLLYSSAPWFLFGTFLYILSLCWNSHFFLALYSWLWWASLWPLIWSFCRVHHLSLFH